jgi:hypothetical protein
MLLCHTREFDSISAGQLNICLMVLDYAGQSLGRVVINPVDPLISFFSEIG